MGMLNLKNDQLVLAPVTEKLWRKKIDRDLDYSNVVKESCKVGTRDTGKDFSPSIIFYSADFTITG